MYILTGGAGFIGSVFLHHLNSLGVEDILLVDNLGKTEKWKNLQGKRFSDYLHKSDFLKRLESGNLPENVKGIVHLGACSSTTESDAEYMMQNNFRYSCALGNWALEKNIRMIYASSAATYGDGAYGFSDDAETSTKLRPMNIYGYSKLAFDHWAARQNLLNNAIGVRFFNVFGPNEYHKADMTSVVFKSFHQIREKGGVRLFRSYLPEYKDGEQKRDFIYAKDCADVLWWMLENKNVNGVFNLGCGEARSWNDLVAAIFSAMKKRPSIEYIEMPTILRAKYQYFTQADVRKLRQAGYTKDFTSLESAVDDYINNYLMQADPIL